MKRRARHPHPGPVVKTETPRPLTGALRPRNRQQRPIYLHQLAPYPQGETTLVPAATADAPLSCGTLTVDSWSGVDAGTQRASSDSFGVW